MTCREGLEGIRDIAFNTERGTGQEDIPSPSIWVAVIIDVQTVLDNQLYVDHQFMLRRTNNTHHSVRSICYADDHKSLASSLLTGALGYRQLGLISLRHDF